MVDLSTSSYDTAWVAMVPSNRDSPNHNNHHHQPSFPGCLEWVMENQKADGSWGLDLSHPSLVKDSLSSTLACVLALQKWKVGEQLVQKGLDFIGTKKYAVMDKYQSSPIGFDVIFPGMINYASDMGLNLPLDSAFIDIMLRNRDLKLRSYKGSRLAYFAEGLGESYDWKEMIKNEQRSNGSLFNSPATTAAALIHLHDDKCFEYLDSLLKIHGNAVVRRTEHQLTEIGDEDRRAAQLHRCWEQRNEEIFLDVACCAMAFRLLRINGYQVSSDAMQEFDVEEHFFNTVSPQSTNTETIVQLYRASQITLFEKEPILDKINGWTSTFLKHQLLNQEIFEEKLRKEVEYALDYPIDNLTRLTNRRGIELFDTENFEMLKTSYRRSGVYSKDFLILSQQEFNKCQAIQLEEFKELEKWVKDHRVGGLAFNRHIVISNYFQVATHYILPEFSDARIIWTKCCVIATIIDDLFDVDGSQEELSNLIDLIEKWDGVSNISALGYSSERIEIIFLALTDIINEHAAKGLIAQGRCIKREWINFVKSCLKELEWWTNKSTPTFDEYLVNGCETIGIGIFAGVYYFIGIELSEDILRSQEYQTLYRHAGLIGRLYNDYQGIIDQRDTDERKLNGCSLIVSQSDGATTIEDARTEVLRMIESSRRELLRMMLTEPSDLPETLIESFFHLYQITYYLYTKNDEFRIPTKRAVEDINGLLYEPLDLLPSNFPKETIGTRDSTS
ncbi:hypothetical protein LguiA_030061 [Lonicera macranthoides]